MTIIALFVMTGSVLLPVKAVIMNLLTLASTLGILVWIFQDGRLEGLFSYDSVGALDLTQPILLGALAFGLSTDYAVFLLSRIKEAHDAGAETTDAVALGLQRTGRIVTAAALLFAVAIGAFATSRVPLIKELGVGTALAVLIDATIIRALLVPSLMALLGKWNWWAPAPLRRLHDRIGFSESGSGRAEGGRGGLSPAQAPPARERDRMPRSLARSHGLLAGGHAQLAVDGAHLGLHGVVRDVQAGGDLARRRRAGQPAQHRDLAVGQLADRAGRGGRRRRGAEARRAARGRGGTDGRGAVDAASSASRLPGAAAGQPQVSGRQADLALDDAGVGELRRRAAPRGEARARRGRLGRRLDGPRGPRAPGRPPRGRPRRAGTPSGAPRRRSRSPRARRAAARSMSPELDGGAAEVAGATTTRGPASQRRPAASRLLEDRQRLAQLVGRRAGRSPAPCRPASATTCRRGGVSATARRPAITAATSSPARSRSIERPEAMAASTRRATAGSSTRPSRPPRPRRATGRPTRRAPG